MQCLIGSKYIFKVQKIQSSFLHLKTAADQRNLSDCFAACDGANGPTFWHYCVFTTHFSKEGHVGLTQVNLLACRTTFVMFLFFALDFWNFNIYYIRVLLFYSALGVALGHWLWQLPILGPLSNRFEILFNKLSSEKCTPILGWQCGVCLPSLSILRGNILKAANQVCSSPFFPLGSLIPSICEAPDSDISISITTGESYSAKEDWAIQLKGPEGLLDRPWSDIVQLHMLWSFLPDCLCNYLHTEINSNFNRLSIMELHCSMLKIQTDALF